MNHRSALTILGWPVSFITEFFRTFRLREHWVSLAIVIGAILILGAFWLGIYLIDFMEIFGISSFRGFWWHAFRQNGPVELVQWLLIATVVLLSALLSGSYMQRAERDAQFFWLLIAIGFSLMLIEDAGDQRHFLVQHFRNFWGTDFKLVEGSVFAVMAGPIVFAVLRYWNVPFRFAQTRLYLVVGGGLYALSAAQSVLRAQWDYHPRVGARISAVLFNGEIDGFAVMNFIVEESVELVSAALFLAGVVMYWRLVRPNRAESSGN